jgi:rare lipoprotein A
MIAQRVPSVAYLPVKSMSSSTFLRFAGISTIALFLANCASEPSRSRGPMSAQNQREIGAFSDKRKYGSASPRVVHHGGTVPKGGGRDHVGRPYRVAGRTYTPRDNPNYSAVGMSSWYGDAFHGRKTANGEVYDKHAYTAAHPTMPLPSYARVTNQTNGRSIIVRVNDRGPFHGGRIIDVSERVANALEFKHIGTARVKVDFVQRASTSGSDDRKLVATLRTDGGAANLSGGSSPIMVAENTFIPGLAASPVPTARPAPTPAAVAIIRQAPEVADAPATDRVAPEREEAQSVLTETRPVRRAVPLPPDRPFDLDTVPGAGTPIARVNNGQPAPVRAAQTGDRVAAIYFAPTQGIKGEFAGAVENWRFCPVWRHSVRARCSASQDLAGRPNIAGRPVPRPCECRTSGCRVEEAWQRQRVASFDERSNALPRDREGFYRSGQGTGSAGNGTCVGCRRCAPDRKLT